MDSVPPAGTAPADSATADIGPAAPGYPGAGRTRNSAAVAAADDSLASLDERPLEDHPEIFTSVHKELQRALAEIDNA